MYASLISISFLCMNNSTDKRERERHRFFKRNFLHLYRLKQLLNAPDCERVMMKTCEIHKKYISHRGSTVRIFIYSFMFFEDIVFQYTSTLFLLLSLLISKFFSCKDKKQRDCQI